MSKRVTIRVSTSHRQDTLTLCQVAYKVEGVVQGVNFRYVPFKIVSGSYISDLKRSFTVKQASSAGLTGFVKNDSDGSVSNIPRSV